MERFVECDGILLFKERVERENLFRFKDLIKIPFLEAPEITGSYPVMIVDLSVL